MIIILTISILDTYINPQISRLKNDKITSNITLIKSYFLNHIINITLLFKYLNLTLIILIIRRLQSERTNVDRKFYQNYDRNYHNQVLSRIHWRLGSNLPIHSVLLLSSWSTHINQSPDKFTVDDNSCYSCHYLPRCICQSGQ